VPAVIRIRGSNLFFDRELQRAGKRFEHHLERRALERADQLAAVSRYAAERTLKFCGLEQRACAVIPNAVDTTLFSPSDQVQTVPGLVVFVNSINPKKGIEQLIGAMNIVCQAHPEAHLVAVGQDTQKRVGGRSYVEWLMDQVRPEFRARVAFVGRMPRDSGVLRYLRQANVCCYPSHMETFGIAAAEAMAVGKPTIYSRTGPGPEVMEDGVSGLLCNPFDAEDIAVKICALLENQPLAAYLGQGARARVLAMFNKKDWIGRNLDYYSRCLEKPSKLSLPRPFASA
jgi:glycosyltransferase involved in cell wall biosynthesis